VLDFIEALQVPEWGTNFLENILEFFTNHQQMEKRHGMAGLWKIRSFGHQEVIHRPFREQ